MADALQDAENALASGCLPVFWPCPRAPPDAPHLHGVWFHPVDESFLTDESLVVRSYRLAAVIVRARENYG